MSILVVSTFSCRRVFIPIAAISYEQRFETSLPARVRLSNNPPSGKTLELGLRDYSKADLEAIKTAGEKLEIRVLGLARIAPDVTPELALSTIESITVLGALQASAELKSALAERIR